MTRLEEIKEILNSSDKSYRPLEDIDWLISRSEKLEAALTLRNKLCEWIQGACGNPNAVEGCRNIIKAIKRQNVEIAALMEEK